jgi:hypothetical protein
MRRVVLGAIVVAGVFVATAITLVAAGHGGPSPDERFAEDVCATSLPWVEDMIEVHDDAVHTRAAPGHDAGWLPVYGIAYRGQEVARKYGTAIRALQVPDTDAGKKAGRYLDWWSRRPLQTMTREERRMRKLPREMTLLQSIRALNAVELQLLIALSEMGDGGILLLVVPELQPAFKRADSCEDLRVLIADA